jgi:hypothetical protein
MAGNTKNLGQVAGVHIGTTPPENTVLIWYDNTPSQKCHKVYDAARKTWVILDQKIISYITYSELVNIAKNVGLSIGKYYQITDRSNALAIAITTTKVQYNDAIGNILIDDLGTNIQYHVTSSNLSVDDVAGVFDETNKKLVFRFNETIPDFTADDYVMGKVQRNNVWRLAKYRLSSFLSEVTGNSISWNGGFYFNFGTTLRNYLDKKGGVVSKDTYDADIKVLATSIQNVGKENQNIIQNAKTNTENATTPTAIYDKELPNALETGGEAIDVAKGDKLVTIISKLQRYINRFKYATGILLSDKFTSLDKGGKVSNNDTVETAIAKLQNQQSNLRFSLPEDWTPNTQTNQNAIAGEEYDSVFGKIEADRQTRNNLQHLLDVVIFNSSEGYNLNYRVENGMLEIRIIQFLKIEWFYTRSIAYDYTRFIPFSFDENFINQIKPFLFLPSGDFNNDRAYRLIPLTTMSLAKVASTNGWETPSYDVKALVSLAYSKYSVYVDDKYVEKEGLGISLTPISKISLVDSKLNIQGVNDNTTFQNLVEDSQVRYYIPPMTIRYKLF